VIGRLVGLVVRVMVLLALLGWLGLGWMYRDRVVAAVRVLRYGPDEAPAVGHASPAALGRADEKLRALDSGRADSVVLGADEVAALVRRAITSRTGDAPDSVAVVLRHDQLEVSALVATAGFRNALPGRARGLLRPSEQVEAAGELVWVAPGTVEWRLSRLLVRGLPVPAEVAGLAMARTGTPIRADGSVLLPVSREVAGLRSGAGQIVLYRRRAA
jgi:hypothetical protein